MMPDPEEEGMRWLLQARRDLDDARYCFDGERFNLACFLSQQAAEKALKAFLYAEGEEIVLGHSVARLVKDVLRYDRGLNSLKGVSVLDKYYIPTRYPNGLPGGVPYEAFDEEDASRAIGLATRVIDRVGAVLEGKGQ